MAKNNKKVQSVEPDIANLANSWLTSYELGIKLEQAAIVLMQNC